MTHTLEIDSVILEFGKNRVLQDIYFKSETGSISGLLGRNGSGKTCLMDIIYGNLNPDSKSVRIDGITLINTYRNPNVLRYLPQFGFTPKNFKIRSIFKYFRLDFDRFINSFPEFKKFYFSKMGELSTGEQRIIEIYSIIVSKSKFCMLDEPFSQVMPIHINTIKRVIAEEKKEKGIIITDHLYEHIIDICDNLYVLSSGKTYLTKDIKELEELGYL